MREAYRPPQVTARWEPGQSLLEPTLSAVASPLPLHRQPIPAALSAPDLQQQLVLHLVPRPPPLLRRQSMEPKPVLVGATRLQLLRDIKVDPLRLPLAVLLTRLRPRPTPVFLYHSTQHPLVVVS